MKCGELDCDTHVDPEHADGLWWEGDTFTCPECGAQNTVAIMGDDDDPEKNVAVVVFVVSKRPVRIVERKRGLKARKSAS